MQCVMASIYRTHLPGGAALLCTTLPTRHSSHLWKTNSKELYLVGKECLALFNCPYVCLFWYELYPSNFIERHRPYPSSIRNT